MKLEKWRAALNRKKYDPLKRKSESWITCAIGERFKLEYPNEVIDVMALTDEAYHLGHIFCKAVNCENRAFAKKVLTQIELLPTIINKTNNISNT